MSPHRRRQIQRRRIVALSVFAVGVLVISLAIDAGGGGSSHHTTGASLQPPPIVSLEATVQEDLRRQAAAQNHHPLRRPPAARDRRDLRQHPRQELPPRMHRPRSYQLLFAPAPGT